MKKRQAHRNTGTTCTVLTLMEVLQGQQEHQQPANLVPLFYSSELMRWVYCIRLHKEVGL